MTWATRIADWLEGVFTDAEKDVIAGLAAGIKQIEENGGPPLLEMAKDEVAAAEAAILAPDSGYQKFLMAQAAILAKFAAEEIIVSKNAVNFAIEAAVAEMNSHKEAV